MQSISRFAVSVEDRGKNVRVGVLGIVLLVALAAAEGGESPKPQPLRVSSSSDLAVPAFGATGNAQCDSQGNLYFHATADVNASTILKLAPDGGKFDFLNLPADEAEVVAFRGFYVAPGGEVWFLAQSKDATYLFKFGHDSTSATKTKLETPDYLVAQDFAVFPDGVSLLAGYMRNPAEKRAGIQSYVAVFEGSGKLRRNIKADDDVEFGNTVESLHQGAAAIGADGLLYLLRPSQVVVFNENGTIDRRLKFEKPEAKFVPTRLDVAGDIVSIQFYRDEGQGKPFTANYLLLNAVTGEPIALYNPDEELGNNLLCFSAQDGFVFERVNGAGRLRLLRAKAR